jgi:RNA polymerase sigma factor (sigma-70 family)
MNSKETHELLVLIKSDNLDAVDVLYSAYAGMMYRKASKRYTLSHEDAWDVIQATFEKLLTAINAYDPERAGGSSWIWRIFTNTAMDLMRQKPTVELTEELLSDFLRGDTDDSDPIEYTEEDELARIARQAFALLPEADRKELIRGRGKAGRKRRSLSEAEARLRRVFFELYH